MDEATTWRPKQQAKHRRLWTQALRSGKYEQTTGGLRQGDRYCCLGVACEISDLGKWKPYADSPDAAFAFMGMGSHLPLAVCDWLGLHDEFGSFENSDGPDTADCLMTLNDSGALFAEIADLIESAPEGLFM